MWHEVHRGQYLLRTHNHKILLCQLGIKSQEELCKRNNIYSHCTHKNALNICDKIQTKFANFDKMFPLDLHFKGSINQCSLVSRLIYSNLKSWPSEPG